MRMPFCCHYSIEGFSLLLALFYGPGTGNEFGFIYLVRAIAKYVHTEITASLMAGLGIGYISSSRLGKAEEFISQALNLSREVGDLQGISHRLSNLGYLFTLFLKEPMKAAHCYEEALEIAFQINDEPQITLTRRNLVIVYIDLGNKLFGDQKYDEAISMYKSALPLSIQVEQSADTSILLTNIGKAYNRLNQYDDSISILVTSFFVATGIESIEESERCIATAIWELWRTRQKISNFDNSLREQIAALNRKNRDLCESFQIEIEDEDTLYSAIVTLMNVIDVNKTSQ